jgi:anaerobic selenocysteine-containing dehydrogenase
VSGKIELYSSTLEHFGHDPLPDWVDPCEGRAREDGEFPLVLVSGPRRRAFINSQFHQLPSVARKVPRPLAEMHPDTAARFGVAHGERVVVVSPRGRIFLEARLTDHVHPDCVVVPAGWDEANANLLTDDGRLDPITGFPGYRSVACRVEPHVDEPGGSTPSA